MAITTDAKDRDLGLVYLDKALAAQAGTHVLIVGVGQFPKAGGVPPLESPPATARKLAEWFLPTPPRPNRFQNPVRPLASLTMLLSEKTDGSMSEVAGGTVPRATFAAMEAAMAGLVTRGEAHPDNLVILYIASHGLGKGDRTGILFEDYGAFPNQRRKGMTDTDQMVRALRRIKPDHKLVFFDCCRNPATTFEEDEELGTALFDPDADGTLSAPAQVLRSTLAGAMAYGNADGTLFGQALMQALGGLAAQPNQSWTVSATSLSDVTGKLLDLHKQDGKSIQVPQSGLVADFPVCVAPQTNRVATFVKVTAPHAGSNWAVHWKGPENLAGQATAEWVGAAHARLDLPSDKVLSLKLDVPGSTEDITATLELDPPVAFPLIPNPYAITPEQTKSVDAAGGPPGPATITVDGGQGVVRVLPPTGAAGAGVSVPEAMADSLPDDTAPPVVLPSGQEMAIRPGRNRLSVTYPDGRTFETDVVVNAGESLALRIPEPATMHEWLAPAVNAGIRVANRPPSVPEAASAPEVAVRTAPVGDAGAGPDIVMDGLAGEPTSGAPAPPAASPHTPMRDFARRRGSRLWGWLAEIVVRTGIGMAPDAVVVGVEASPRPGTTPGKPVREVASPGVRLVVLDQDEGFYRYRVDDDIVRRFPPKAPAYPEALPVWVSTSGEGWNETAFLPTLGREGWDVELLIDAAADPRSHMIAYVIDPVWNPLLAFLGRRDFPNTAESLKQLGPDTIRDAIWGKQENPLAATAGVLAAVACGPISDAGLQEEWLVNVADWFVGLPDGKVALGRHLQREGRMDAALEAYRQAFRRGVPVFSLAVDWLAEGLESFDDENAPEALRWSRMADSLRTFTVLRMGGT